MTDSYVQHGENVTLVPKALVKQVRRFIQDFVEVNEIYDGGEETADHQIARYIVDEVDTWNGWPPINPASQINAVSLIAVPSFGAIRKGIIDATSARVLKSVVIKLARNDMPYTAGNVTTQPNSVWRNLQPIIQDLELQYKEFRTSYKISANTESAYGVTHSELFLGVYGTRDGYIAVEF